ncbi:MAG: Hsp20/alpha crystallin family protein [Burkholderiaceae bacterium]
MSTKQVKQGTGRAPTSVSHGWLGLRHRARGALTRFGSRVETGAESAERYYSLGNRDFIAADVSAGQRSIVVQRQALGMGRSEFRIELHGNNPSIQGERRMGRGFPGEDHDSVQSFCVSLRRVVPLPAAVNPDKARATYRDGILRVVLPKNDGASSRRLAAQVH